MPFDARQKIDEGALVNALRRGDEEAFLAVVSRYHAAMLRLALIYLPDPAVAEEVVQETWMGVLRGISRFEGRSSLKTWMFRILTNRAKTRRQRENRSIPFSDLERDEESSDEPAVSPERFRPMDAGLWPGGWSDPPRPWNPAPEEQTLNHELMQRMLHAVEELPHNQRTIIALRDIEGWSSEEVCSLLALTETNQRVLLHRARSKVRRAIEVYFDEKAV